MPRNRGSREKKDGAGRFIEVAACYGGFRLPAVVEMVGEGEERRAELELERGGREKKRGASD
jgi:hypothetical protein